MNDKNKKTTTQSTKPTQPTQSPAPEIAPGTPAEPSSHTWVDDMKQELEDYIEDQGIYIRQ